MPAPKRPAPKRPAPKRPCAQTVAPKWRSPNGGAQTSCFMSGDIPGNVRVECEDTVPEWHNRNLVTLCMRALRYILNQSVVGREEF